MRVRLSLRSVALPVALAAALCVALTLPGCRHLDADAPEPSDAGTVLWSGAVTPTSARVHARVPEGVSGVRLAVSRQPDFGAARFVDGTVPAATPGVVQFALDALDPGTVYHYALARGNAVDSTRSGRFRTFDAGPHDFRVALGGCAETGSQHPVFDAIRDARPDLFLHLGDLHYEDIDEPNPAAFERAYQQVHASTRQAALFRSTPIAYVWDDHDYGPNNSTRAAPGQDVAQQVYRAYVPHYPLATGPGAHPIYQAFSVGRVRFVMTDLRSARTPQAVEDPARRTMMGAEQKAWFKAELVRARDRYPVILWVSSVPWIGDEDAADRWSGFARERRELARYIDSIGVADQLAMLSGDAHMVALDDGTHNRYGLEDGGGFPVVHAAALDQRGSVKGGPYTHGPYPNRVTLLGDNDGQFVLMDVRDDGGDAVCITWTGRRLAYDTGRLVDLLQWERCFPATPHASATP